MTTTPADKVTQADDAIAELVDGFIQGYQRIREKCYQAAQRDNARLMGESAWLSNALNATDIEIAVTPQGVRCTGTTYTSQTLGHEWFDFTVPFAVLDHI